MAIQGYFHYSAEQEAIGLCMGKTEPNRCMVTICGESVEMPYTEMSSRGPLADHATRFGDSVFLGYGEVTRVGRDTNLDRFLDTIDSWRDPYCEDFGQTFD